MHYVGAHHRDTPPLSRSLSPNLISWVDVASFSLMMGTDPFFSSV